MPPFSHRKNLEKSNPPIEVHVTRGNWTESVHLVDAVILDSKAQVVAGFGEFEKVRTYPRSTIKMIQALYLVESGAYSSLGLTPAHLTLACASHNGEPAHTDLLMSWLEKIQALESDLVCGAHTPYDEKTAQDLIRKGIKPCPRHNNCSGKHAGILSALKKEKIDIRHYGNYDHPLQIKFRKMLTETSGDLLDQAPWGPDGCGIPTYAMTLIGMAKSLSLLNLDPSLPAERSAALKLIRTSVISEPFYLGGTNDFCTDLIAEAGDRMIVKAGAEGVYAGALFEPGYSFALKVRDGNGRASRVAVAKLLSAFQGLSEDEFVKLSRHTEPFVKNYSGETVGKIFVPFPLFS